MVGVSRGLSLFFLLVYVQSSYHLWLVPTILNNLLKGKFLGNRKLSIKACLEDFLRFFLQEKLQKFGDELPRFQTDVWKKWKPARLPLGQFFPQRKVLVKCKHLRGL